MSTIRAFSCCTKSLFDTAISVSSEATFQHRCLGFGRPTNRSLTIRSTHAPWLLATRSKSRRLTVARRSNLRVGMTQSTWVPTTLDSGWTWTDMVRRAVGTASSRTDSLSSVWLAAVWVALGRKTSKSPGNGNARSAYCNRFWSSGPNTMSARSLSLSILWTGEISFISCSELSDSTPATRWALDADRWRLVDRVSRSWWYADDHLAWSEGGVGLRPDRPADNDSLLS